MARGILTRSAQVIDLGWLSLFQVIGSRSSDLGHVLMGLEGRLECSVLNIGLLLGEVVSMKKTHIVAKDVVGLQVGDSKNDSLTKMKTYQ